MALTRATRYIVSEKILDYERRNYEEIGAKFRIGTIISSSKPELDAEWSVKALNGAPKKESEKTSSGGLKDRVPELRFAPNKKRSPGDILKLHVTAKDMLKSGDEPNFGWITPEPELSFKERKAKTQEAFRQHFSKPKIVVDKYQVDRRTGQRIEESREPVEVKALGRSLGRLVPGGNLGRRAARALKLVVDADGKFRCPPGTPAANQFTDEFGTNCFTPPASARRALGRLSDWYNAHIDRGLLMIGTDEAAIAYLARQGYDWNENVRAMDEAMQMVAPEEVFQREAAALQEAIDELRKMVAGGSEETRFNEHLWDLLDRLQKSGMWDIDFSDLFAGIYGESVWDNDADLRTNLDALNAKLSQDYMELVPDTLPEAERTELVKELVERHHEAVGGFLESQLREFYDNPEAAKLVTNFGTFGSRGTDFDDFFNVEAEARPISFDPEKGVSSFGMQLVFNPAAIALMPFMDLEEGSRYVVRTDGTGSEGEQWAVIQDFFKNRLDMERFSSWSQTYGNDLSAARHGASVRAKARHVGHHEFGHILQYQAVGQLVVDQYKEKGVFFIPDGQEGIRALTDDPNLWTSGEWGAALNAALQNSLPELNDLSGFPPGGVHAFEGSMLHILSGAYYQDLLNKWRNGAGTPEESQRLAVMLMEGMTELRALKKMGVLDSEKIDKAIAWMDEKADPPKPPSQPWEARPLGTPTSDIVPDPATPSKGFDGKVPARPPQGQSANRPSSSQNGNSVLENLPPVTEGDSASLLQRWRNLASYRDQKGLPSDLQNGTNVRKTMNDYWGFEDTDWNKTSVEELDRRGEKALSRVKELSNKNTEDLTEEEAAELAFGLSYLRAISSENKRRQNRRHWSSFEPGQGKTPAQNKAIEEAREQVAKGYPTDYGKYYSDHDEWQNPTRDKRDDFEFFSDTELTEAARAAERKLGDENALTKDRAGTGSNKFTVQEKESVERTYRDPVGDALDDPEQIKRLREAGNLAEPQDAIAARAIDMTEAPEQLILFAPQQDVPSGMRSERFSSYLVANSILEDPPQGYDKVILPKGARGAIVERPGQEYAGILLPPGTLKELQAHPETDQRSLIVASQDSASKFARRELQRIDDMRPPTSVAELRRRRESRAALQSIVEPEPRVVQQPLSSDRAVRDNLVTRNNQINTNLYLDRVEPFSPDARTRDTSRDVNASSKLAQISTDFDQKYGSGTVVDNQAIQWSPEVMEFLNSGSRSEVRQRVSEATMTWHDGLDKRPRLRVTSEEVNRLLAGDDESSISSKTYTGYEMQMHRNLGWPDHASPITRPMFGHMVHGSHENIVDQILRSSEKGQYPITRRGEFFDHSGTTPRGSNLGAFGDIDVVLRPETSMRTAYGIGDLMSDSASPTLVNQRMPAVVSGNLTVSRRGDNQTAANIHNFLHANLTGDYRGIQKQQLPFSGPAGRRVEEFGDADRSIEAAIASGIGLMDIERVDVPISALNWKRQPIGFDVKESPNDVWAKLRKAGWSESEIDYLQNGISSGQFTGLKSINLLRQHLAAKEDRERFNNLNIDVRYTNKDAVDLFSRHDLTSQTASGIRIGRVRDVEEALQIQMADEILARQSTLRPIVRQDMQVEMNN